MKKFLYRNIKRIIRLYFTLRTINWVDFFRLYSKDANVVVLMRPQFRSIFQDTFEPDVVLIGVIVKLGLPFRIYFGREYGSFYNRTIVFNSSYLFNEHKFQNYSSFQAYVMAQLEYQGNIVFPRANEIVFWENKEYMYTRFKELGIKHPETHMFHSFNDFKKANLSYPLLIKEAHSHGAEGVFKLNSPDEAEQFLNGERFKNNNRVISNHQSFSFIFRLD